MAQLGEPHQSCNDPETAGASLFKCERGYLQSHGIDLQLFRPEIQQRVAGVLDECLDRKVLEVARHKDLAKTGDALASAKKLDTQTHRPFADKFQPSNLAFTTATVLEARTVSAMPVPSRNTPRTAVEDMVIPSQVVLQAVEMLEEKHGIIVEAPALYPTAQVQTDYREQFFGPAKWAAIYELQQDPRFKEITNVEKYYREVAGKMLYVAGKITRRNLGVMLGLTGKDLMQLVGTVEDGQLRRKNSIELACGNAGMSMGVMEAYHDFKAYAHMFHGKPIKGPLTRRHFDALLQRAWNDAAERPGRVDPHIVAVDLIKAFTDKTREKLICGIPADVCLPSEQFLEITGLAPNSMDFIFMNLAFDRLPNLLATLQNMKRLVKSSGSTQFIFGFYAPFSSKTISFSQNPNIPQIDCFDPNYDMRKNWIGLDRTETIYQIVKDLNMHGFRTDRIAEDFYEVYSPHCIIEPAGALRTDPRYQFLKIHDFEDPHLNARRDAVFNQVSHQGLAGQTKHLNTTSTPLHQFIPDHELIGFPEREKNRFNFRKNHHAGGWVRY